MESVVEYLKLIESHTKKKEAFHIIQSANSSKITTFFDPPLVFDDECKYEIRARARARILLFLSKCWTA